MRIIRRDSNQTAAGHPLLWKRGFAHGRMTWSVLGDKLAVDVVLAARREAKVEMGIRVVPPFLWRNQPVVSLAAGYLAVCHCEPNVAEMWHRWYNVHEIGSLEICY